jgi:RsbT co-antagonist protein rsbRD N-terminal domain
VLTRRFIKMIETRADKVAKLWLKEVKQSRYTPTYQHFPEELLFERAMAIYERLGYWLSPETKKEEIRHFYMNLGGRRYQEGFSLEEVIMAIILLKRYLWLEVISEGLTSTNLELYQALELNNQVVLYFDRAIYYTTVGYMEGLQAAGAMSK